MTVIANPATGALIAGGPGNVSIEDLGNVVAIDPSDGSTLATIPIPGTVMELGVNGTTNTIYAGNRADGLLYVIDGATYAVTATIALPEHGLAFGIAVDDLANAVYVASISNESGSWVSSIVKIDGATNAIVAEWDDATIGYQQILAVAVNRQTGRLYAIGELASEQVLSFDTTDLTLTTSIAIGGGPGSVVVDEGTDRVYVARRSSSTEIAIRDGGTLASLGSISVPGASYADSLVLDGANGRLFAQTSGGPTGSLLSIVDLGSNTVTQTISTSPSSYAVGFDAAAGVVYTTDGQGGAIDGYEMRDCSAPDVTSPAVHVDSPADGAELPIYSRAVASYACTDDGSGLALGFDPYIGYDYCFGGDLANHMPVASGGLLDTMTLGPKTFTVTATDNAGLTTTVTHTYTVVGDVDTDAPQITVNAPVEGASYNLADGQVLADYTCTDAGGSELAYCSGSAEHGGPIDLSPYGAAERTFTVYAGDRAGNYTQLEVHYTVVAPDNEAPSIAIMSPQSKEYSLGRFIPANYSCSDSQSGVASCVGDVPLGASVTEIAGARTLTVNATDNAGNESSRSVNFVIRAGDWSGTVVNGGTVSTDPSSMGAWSGVPIQTQIQVHPSVSGFISVTPQSLPAAPPGYTSIGRIATSGPASTANFPYRATFDIAAEVLDGVPASGVQLSFNGAVVPACTAVSTAVPDPCVEFRGPQGSGARLRVRTSQLGTWTFSRAAVFVESGLGEIGRGARNITRTITGYGFVDGATVSVPGGGVTVHSTTVVNGNTLQVDLSVSTTAALGARDVRVTTPGSPAIVTTCAGCATVNERPIVTSISISRVPQGTERRITVEGSGLRLYGIVDFGAGIGPNLFFGGPTSGSVHFTVAPDAPPGKRSITFTNLDGGTFTLANALTIVVPPTVTSAGTGAIGQGVTASIPIFGTNFPPATSITGVDFGPGITVTSFVRNSATKLTAQVVVDADTEPGPRTVGLYTSDDFVPTTCECLTVNAAPTVDTITPAALSRGSAHRSVVVAGSGFQIGAKVTVPGGGVTVHSATVTDANTLTLDVTVSGTAVLGARNVTVTNPDKGTVTCAGCFTVNPKPTVTAVAPGSVARGASYTVVITGTGFQTGATVAFAGGDVVVNAVSGAGTTLTVDITVAPTAALTRRAVTVTNPDTGTVTKTSVLRIT